MNPHSQEPAALPPAPASSSATARVCAVVVTFKRQDLLVRCLRALQEQSRKVDHILVVDNASHDGTVERVRAEFPQVEVLELTHNVGGAGGFHDGMKHAYEQGYDWLWIMDDDGAPAPDCLQKLLDADERPGARVPLQQDEGGRFYGIGRWPNFEVDVTDEIIARGEPVEGRFLFAFVGPLLHREIVQQLGLPIHEFFIWFDDVEYALRIGTRSRLPIIIVPGAHMAHNFGTVRQEARFLWLRSFRGYYAPWKLYYGVRNPTYIILHRRRRRAEFHRFLRLQLRHLAGDLMFEPTDRWERVRNRLRGLRDGMRQNMGRQH